MAQRVLVATCLVVSLASLFLAGTMWVQTNRDRARAQEESARAAYEAVKAIALQNARAEAGQQELAKQLRAMADEMRSARSLDWNPVSFQLTEETAGGPPAIGFSVTLNEAVPGGAAGSGGGGPKKTTTRVSDRSGIVDLGVVHPGTYSYTISKAWDDSSINTGGELVIEPGSRIVKKVVCPRTPPEHAMVRVRTAWPADLEKEGLVLYASFSSRGLHYDENLWWRGNHAWAVWSLLCGPGSSRNEVGGLKAPVIWGPQSAENLWVDISAHDIVEAEAPEKPLEMLAGNYELNKLFVLRPAATADGGSHRHFELLAASTAGMSQLHFAVRDAPPSEQEENEQDFGRFGPPIPASLWVAPPGQDGPLGGTTGFEARPGQVSEWTIPLWDELLTTVRESLKTSR
jgi:hypothetical protein